LGKYYYYDGMFQYLFQYCNLLIALDSNFDITINLALLAQLIYYSGMIQSILLVAISLMLSGANVEINFYFIGSNYLLLWYDSIYIIGSQIINVVRI
jgi:hypothetical protein